MQFPCGKRGDRVADCTGLENRRPERDPGFKSQSHRVTVFELGSPSDDCGSNRSPTVVCGLGACRAWAVHALHL